jgi:hypothetical protein
MTGLFSCGIKVCPPTEQQKTFINSVNPKLQDKLTIEHVPCYYDYMYVYLKGDYDKNLIDSLEKVYRQTISFAEFLVHDKSGKLIRGNTGSM